MGQALEEGEEGDNYVPTSQAERERLERSRHEGLWGDHDEEYYNDGELPLQDLRAECPVVPMRLLIVT